MQGSSVKGDCVGREAEDKDVNGRADDSPTQGALFWIGRKSSGRVFLVRGAVASVARTVSQPALITPDDLAAGTSRQGPPDREIDAA